MTSERASTPTQLSEANLFDVGGPIHINYARSSITGRPQLSYQDADVDRTFQGDQLDCVETPIGQLVTVTLDIVPDAFDRRISLLVPIIRTERGSEQEFDTVLIETVDRSQAHVLPPGPAGVLQSYRVHQLHGSAQLVDF